MHVYQQSEKSNVSYAAQYSRETIPTYGKLIYTAFNHKHILF